MIYLDNNATTPILPEVQEAMLPFLGDAFANPSSVYQPATRNRAVIERCRGQVAKCIGAQPPEVIFTGSGSESNNHAIMGTLLRHLGKKGNVVTSAVEHPSVKNTVDWACRTFGFELRVVPFKATAGVVEIDPFAAAIDEQTLLVSVMAANNETGVILPVKAIAALARKKGAVMHSDGIQACGKLPVDVRDWGVDLLSLSAHKFHGPKGAAALFIRRGLDLEALVHGGGQESGRRAGTENVAYIVGLTKALTAAYEHGTEAIRDLRDRFEAKIQQRFGPHAVNHFAAFERVPNASSITFPGQDGNLLVIKLDRQGICVSTGAACSSGALTASQGLMATGLSEAEAVASIRFSFSRFNTAAEVDQVVDVLAGMVLGKIAKAAIG